jgi:SulP family sulfate permease
LVKLGSGYLAHIPLAALAGVTAWMGFCLLDWSAWRRLTKMRPIDAGAFLATAISVLMVNAVAAVLIGCLPYLVQYLRERAATLGPRAQALDVAGAQGQLSRH